MKTNLCQEYVFTVFTTKFSQLIVRDVVGLALAELGIVCGTDSYRELTPESKTS